MTITIDAKPLEVRAELPGYGIFYLRRLGAAKEAELGEMFENLNIKREAFQKKYQKLIDNEAKLIADKNDGELENLRASEEYQACKKEQTEQQKELERATNYLNKTCLSLWRSDEPKAIERLANDFTNAQIQEFYRQVMEQAEAENA